MKMDWKTIASAVLCPVLGLSCAGKGQPEPVPVIRSTSSDTGYVLPGPAFSVTVPDSVVTPVLWADSHPLLLVETSGNGPVQPGDTLAMGSDPYLSLENERVLMELEMALATGDSAAFDSLSGILADSSRFIPLVSTAAGEAVILVVEGETIQPGDAVAQVTGPPPDSVFIVHPLPGQTNWPSGLSGTISGSGMLVRSGHPPEGETTLPGIYLVEQRYIHEEGLRSFLLGAGGDTLQVHVAGTHDGLRIIHSETPLESIPLTAWD